ncbi:hypothetical protein, partial [Propionivibrio sp.]|uniref:hypothetical protein n=1 Tax=Propionivibrio sp. TaxID=2212460 RepID=UPI00272ECB8B
QTKPHQQPCHDLRCFHLSSLSKNASPSSSDNIAQITKTSDEQLRKKWVLPCYSFCLISIDRRLTEKKPVANLHS